MTPRSRLVLLVALIALAVLYGTWFARDRHLVASLCVFVAPALWLAGLVFVRTSRAHFWAGLASLAWFTHAVTVLYERPGDRVWASAELALALVILFAGSLPGLRGRFAKRRAS